MRRSVAATGLLLGCAALASCARAPSPSAGGASSSHATYTVTPHVASAASAPEDVILVHDTLTEISVHFDDPLDPASADAAHVYALDAAGAKLPAANRYDAVSGMLTVALGAPVVPSTEIRRVTVRMRGLRTASGVALPDKTMRLDVVK